MINLSALSWIDLCIFVQRESRTIGYPPEVGIATVLWEMYLS